MTDHPRTRAPYTLSAALAAEPDPPCSKCEFALVCNLPDKCKPFSRYVQFGKKVEPPTTPPWS